MAIRLRCESVRLRYRSFGRNLQASPRGWGADGLRTASGPPPDGSLYPAGDTRAGRGAGARGPGPVLVPCDMDFTELLLKGELTRDHDIVVEHDLDEDEAFSRIRCPLCEWQPGRTSMWRCTRVDAPEGFLQGCGTAWNTFSTRGKCPGCGHQWRWTKCMRCDGWSLHDDWYEEPEAGRSRP